MVPTIKELQQKRRRVAQADMQAGFVTGYTGQINPDGSKTASDKYGTIFVRIGATSAADARPATRVSNSRVDTASDLPVVLWKLNGKWDVFCLNTPRAVDQLGARVGNAAIPRRVGDEVAETVIGRRVKPGRVRVWNGGTLEVNAEAFVYIDTAGDLKLWQPDFSNALDIASFVPAAVSGADMGRWVYLALNPDATTPVLEAFDDTPISVLIHNSGDTRWKDIVIPDGYYPLDPVWLQTGDATIASESRYAFGRLLLDKVGASGGSAAAEDVTYDNATSGLSATDVQAAIDELEGIVTGGGGGALGDYILIRDEKSAGTGGGTFTAGAWRTRTLNTEVVDTGNHASLSSNQITLDAGTYRFHISCPAQRVGRHQARLYNISDSAEVERGTSNYAYDQSSGSVENTSEIIGRVTIASTKTFEVQHQGAVTSNTFGFGVDANLGGTEVYTVAQFWKE